MEEAFEFAQKDALAISGTSNTHKINNAVKVPSFQVISRVISDIEVRDEFPFEARNIKSDTCTGFKSHQKSAQTPPQETEVQEVTEEVIDRILQISICPPAAMRDLLPTGPTTIIKKKKQPKTIR